MPETKRTRARLTAPIPNSDDETRAAIEVLRRWHRIGKEAVAAIPEGSKNDGPTVRRLAEREGVNRSIIRQARQFARLYDTEEKLDALLALRDPKGEPLKWTLVQQLLLLEDETERTCFQAQAAREGRSVRMTRAAARAKVGGDKSSASKKRRSGGRRFRSPEDPRDALRKLVELSRQWLKYYDDIGADSSQSILIKIAEASPGEQDAGLSEQTRETKAVLGKLERGARKAANRLRGAESKTRERQSGRAKESGRERST